MRATVRFSGIEDAPPGYHVPLMAVFEVRRPDGGEYPIHVPIQVGAHGRVSGQPVWGWDGSREAPTLTPSIRSRLGRDGELHCFLKGGKIEPCSDNRIEVVT